MAVAVQSTGGVATKTTGTTLTITAPASIALGDLLIIHAMSETSITTLAGWTLTETNSNTGIVVYLYWKIAEAGDVGAANFAFTTANEASAGACFRITGHDATTPIGADNSGTGNSTSISFTGVTPAKITSLIMVFVSSNTAGVTTCADYAIATSSPAFSEHYDAQYDTNSFQISAASGLRTVATATGNVTATLSNGSPYVGIVAAIAPADSSSTVTPSALALTSTAPANGFVVSSNFAVNPLSLTTNSTSPTLLAQDFPAFANTAKNASSWVNTSKS